MGRFIRAGSCHQFIDRRTAGISEANRHSYFKFNHNEMGNKTHLIPALFSLSVLIILACSGKESKNTKQQVPARFDPNGLLVQENSNTKKVRGQVLYLPVYSNIPYFEHGKNFDLNAFVAIHNTDFSHKLKITKVLFFDNDGNPVFNFLSKEVILQPLGATNFFVPERDKSGTGANFIVEWVADTTINEPLIESVMIGLTGGQGVSFSSVGRIVRESK